MSDQIQLFIDGAWTSGTGSESFESLDPATGEVIATAVEATAADVDEAVAAARAAFPGWAAVLPAARAALLHRLAELIEENGDELAEMETRDQGQSILFARGSMSGAAEMLRYYAGWCTKITGDVSPVSIPGMMHYTRREPVGVCALITPWNFPLTIAVWKLAPALAAGNTVVLKPAEQTPISTAKLAELCQRAGIPDGVVNVVQGGPAVGQRLVDHGDVDKVSFTGSGEVGRKIIRGAAGNFKRVSLELGGKAPSIVMADADIDGAIQGNMMSALLNCGQACAAYARFYVDRSRVDEFTEKVAAAMRTLKMGPGISPESQVGPLVTEEHRQKVAGYVESGVSQGAEVVLGGRTADSAGFFYEPTLLTGVRHDMTIAREEVFGPVLPIIAYDDPDELVDLANDTDYGLVASVWTGDVARGHRMAHAIRAGEIFVNSGAMLDPAAPWGGFKGSGWGREMTGEALNSYTETKGIWVNLGE